MSKTNERLREIRERVNPSASNQPEMVYWSHAKGDIEFILARLDEVVKLLRTIYQRDAWHSPTCVCEVCEDTRRILAELEKGE